LSSYAQLSDWNPWWRSKQAIYADQEVQNWEKSSFKWLPRLIETFENLDVIYVLRGPRRVGKTTLLKLKIKHLIESGVKPENIFFYPCDLIEDPRQLVSIIDLYLSKVRDPSERAFIFIDEISMLKDWQRGIKVLVDSGKLRNCTVVLTGSHSIDLKKSTETLSGRRGEVYKLKYQTPDKLMLPCKFSEYVETINKNVKEAIRYFRPLPIGKRRDILLQLGRGEISKELEKIYLLFSSDLRDLLEDYLIVGGIAQAIDEYIKTRRVSDNTYATFINFLIRDITRWKTNYLYARQIIRRVIETLSTPISWYTLKEGTEIRDPKTAETYVDTLKESFVLLYLYQLDVNNKTPSYRKDKKIYFQDPFIFHACRSWIYGKSAFSSSLDFIRTEENKSKLIECIISDHLVRYTFNVYSTPLYDPTNYVFYWKSKKRREVDFIVRINDKFLPIEVKYKEKIKRRDAFGIFDFIKTGISFEYGIIISKESLKINKKYLEIPAYLFLLLP